MALKCPSCGGENAEGKLFCYKCGTKLIHPKAGQAAGAGAGPARLPDGAVAHVSDSSKRKGSKSAGIVVLVILLLLGGVAFLGLQPVDYPSVPSGGGAMDSVQKRYMSLESDLRSKGEVELEIREGELNYLWDKAWPILQNQVNKGGFVRVQGLRVRMPGDHISQYAQLSIKGKRAFLRTDIDVTAERGEVKTKIVGGALGKLPLPGPLAGLVAKQMMKQQEIVPMSGAGGQALYFDAVDIQPGKVFIRVTTDSVVTGGRAGRLIEDSRTAAREKRFGDAVRALQSVMEDYPGSDEAATAEADYQGLLREADRRLGAADAAYQTGRYAEALKAYGLVAQGFPGSEAAAKATEQLRSMHSDPAVQRHIREQEMEAELGSKFQLAENLFNAGNYDSAEREYRKIIDAHPDSRYADQARERLKDLGRY